MTKSPMWQRMIVLGLVLALVGFAAFVAGSNIEGIKHWWSEQIGWMKFFYGVIASVILLSILSIYHHRPCPHCNESVWKIASVCPHCGRDIVE